jgi:leucyl/phenylalanyl-tRNA--protein transferase
MNHLPMLDPTVRDRFPDPRHALADPNGLLAFGGDLSAERLLQAYRQGIFPWFSQDEPILWWSPDPRCVFRTETLRVNRSLRRQLVGKAWHVSIDHDFEQVIRACAMPRDAHDGTWLVPQMIDAYAQLHRLGHAHSVEVWDGKRLVGGIYGVAIGKLFCGESMFSAESGGSKIALIALAKRLQELGFPLLDTQVSNPHTLSLGAIELPRAQFLDQARRLVQLPGETGSWAHHTAHLWQPCASRDPR